MAVVYQHIRKDTNEVFYIGIGKTIARSKSKISRNNYWHHIVNLCGYDIEIIHNNITWEDACELEKFYIQKFGRKDLGLGTLVNMTNGGDGVVGQIVSQKTRDKISKSTKGKKMSEESKKKMSQSHKGKKMSEESKKKISIIKKGHKASDKTKQKMSLSRFGEKNHFFGKNHSDDTKQKMSQLKKDKYVGELHPFFGKNHSNETKQKMSQLKKDKYVAESHPFFGKKHSTDSLEKMSKNLKKEDIIWIRNNYISRHEIYGGKSLSIKFGITTSAISKIIKGKTWKDI